MIVHASVSVGALFVSLADSVIYGWDTGTSVIFLNPIHACCSFDSSKFFRMNRRLKIRHTVDLSCYSALATRIIVGKIEPG